MRRAAVVVCAAALACGPNQQSEESESDSQDGSVVDECAEPTAPRTDTCGDGLRQRGEVCLGTSSFFPLQITDEQPYGTTPTLLVIDADNDGHVDLITGARALMGDGEGGVREVVLAPNQANEGTAQPIDFDVDGVMDLAWRNDAGVYPGENHTDMWRPWDATDLNDDGVPDLLLVLELGDDDEYGAYVAYGEGNGAFAEPVALGNERPWFAIKAVDFNEDGVTDLAGVIEAEPTVFGGVEVVFQER